MKARLLCIFLAIICISLVSCSSKNEPASDSSDSISDSTIDVSQDNSESENETSVDNSTAEQDLSQELISPVTDIPEENGGNSFCMIHSTAYHQFSGTLVDYIGQEEVNEWLDRVGKTPCYDNPTGCIYPDATCYAFIKYFDIPKNVVIDAFNNDRNLGYNVDLLYQGTPEENDNYYRSIPTQITFEQDKLSRLFEIKLALYANKKEAFTQSFNTNQYSVVELIRLTDTSYDFVKEWAEKKKESPTPPYSQYFDYSYELLESKTDEELDQMIAEHTPFYLDCLFCGITPYDSRYEKQIADNQKYGILDYADAD